MAGTRPPVLVVDPDPLVRDLLTELLRVWGYPAKEAASLAELLDLLSRAEYSLAIAEYLEPTHPLADAWPALPVLQELAPRTPIVALYSESPPKKDASVVGVLPRPFPEGDLRRLVERHAHRSVGLPQNPRLASYLRSLWMSDSEGAFRVVDEMRRDGASVDAVFEELFAGALHQFGRWWSSGSCRIANEHNATAITTQLIERTVSGVPHAPPNGRKAVLSCAPRELHEVAIRMADHLLRIDGWDTHLLGADTPALELIGYCERRDPDLIAISATLAVDQPGLRQLISSLKSRCESAVILGGQAFTGPEQARMLGADSYAARVSDVAAVARSLVRGRQGQAA